MTATSKFPFLIGLALILTILNMTLFLMPFPERAIFWLGLIFSTLPLFILIFVLIVLYRETYNKKQSEQYISNDSKENSLTSKFSSPAYAEYFTSQKTFPAYRKIIGFRTLTPWKMLLAGLFFASFFYILFSGIIGGHLELLDFLSVIICYIIVYSAVAAGAGFTEKRPPFPYILISLAALIILFITFTISGVFENNTTLKLLINLVLLMIMNFLLILIATFFFAFIHKKSLRFIKNIFKVPWHFLLPILMILIIVVFILAYIPSYVSSKNLIDALTSILFINLFYCIIAFIAVCSFARIIQKKLRYYFLHFLFLLPLLLTEIVLFFVIGEQVMPK